MGVDPMVDISQSLDTGLYNPVKLSPVYMGGCMKKCDKIKPSNIKEDDYSINYCLQFGFCGESLANICKEMDEKGETSKNSLLNQYCSLRKSKKSSSHQPSQKTQTKQENTQEPKKLKSSSNNITHLNNSNNSYSNNIGVFSVIIILVLICIFMANSKK
jgi:hypothetical protein